MRNDRSIVIGLLARDCKESLLRNIPRIERLCSCFADYYVVAVENDSADGTEEVLRDWAMKDNRVIVDSFTNHSLRRTDSGYARISHMAYLRNRLLEDIKKLPAPNLVIMMDADIFDFDVEGLIDGIEHAPDDWGALMANGRNMLPNQKFLRAQYDQYAYMAYDEEMSDMTMGVFTSRSLSRRGIALNKAILACDFFPVKSAFGGIGIYRYEAIKDLRYQTIMIGDGHRKAYCEHMPFHLEIVKQGYKNYICRSILVNNGILKVRPMVAFLLYYFPQVHAMLCDVSKFIHQYVRL